MLADDTVLAIEFEPQTRHDAMPQARSQNMFRDTGFTVRQQGLFFDAQRANERDLAAVFRSRG
jgi:hypothetical protein